MCFVRVIWLSNNTNVDKNAIFCWLFPQVVQKQTLGKVGN